MKLDNDGDDVDVDVDVDECYSHFVVPSLVVEDRMLRDDDGDGYCY